MSLPRHVLITGGSRGIGLSIAQHFAQHSYRCTLISRSEDSLKSAISTLKPPPILNHSYISDDITTPNFWTSSIFAKHIARPTADDSSGRIDVLVNCAGITQNRLFTSMPQEDVQKIIDTNLTSLMIGTRFLLRQRYISKTKTSSNEGKREDEEYNPCIINLSSLLGLQGGHGAVAYAASKAGVLGFTRALATELGTQGIRVNAIVPGYIETDMTKDLSYPSLLSKIPLRRFGQPSEIAHAALFLAQNQYAHNCVLNLDGGLSAV